MKKLANVLTLKLISIWVLVLLTACGGVSGSTSAGGNSGSTASTAITIDRTSIVPVFANQKTSSVVYVHNNTDHTISDITYTIIGNQQSGNTFSLSSGCNTIAAKSSCALGFTTPALTAAEAQGSAIIKANYSSGSSIQVINYQVVQDRNSDGVFISSSIELAAPDGQPSYATVYVYGSGYNNSYIINNINVDNPSISVIDHSITNSMIRSGQVKAFEVSYDGPQSLVTKLTVNSFNQSGNTFSYAANVAVSASSNGGILTSGLVPIINASNTAPTGTLYVVNSGNATSSLGNISYGSGISAGTAGPNACSSSLASGSYCIIYFNVTQAGGSANITLPYDSTNSVVQNVTWYNPVSGALLQIVANPNPVLINTGISSTTSTVTISNIGGYDITGLDVSTATTLSGSGSASVSGLSCHAGSTNLPVGQVCTYTIAASDNIAESNQAFNLQVSGSYNNGSAQTYTRKYVLNYTSLVIQGSMVSTNGGNYTCATNNASISNLNCWGAGGSGTIGNGAGQFLVPTLTTLPSGVNTFTGLSSNTNFSCAIASSGTNAGNIYCWGFGFSGQLGSGSNNTIYLPTSVTMPTGVNAFSQISTNINYSCALASAGANAGKVYCWGTGTSGQIGNSASSNVNVPTSVTMPDGVTFSQVYTDGAGTSCAIATNGNAYCWGLGTSGQIGNSASSTVNVPTAVTMPGGVTFTALSMPNQNVGYTCAIGSNGTIYCWGAGTSGALGNGSTSNVNLPTAVTMPSGVTAFSQVMTSASSTPASLTCAIASAGANAGRVYCSGLGTSGQIGNGANSTVNVLTGVTMPSGVTAFSQLAVNSAAGVCAIAASGANAGVIYCWGTGTSGQIGNGATSNVNVLTAVTMPSGVTAFSQVYANSGTNICAIASAGANAGSIYCWGQGIYGQIGNGSIAANISGTVSVPTLATLPIGASVFNQVTTNSFYSCALASAGSNSGQIYCWGLNTTGTIGNNVLVDSLVQAKVTLPSGVTTFGQISTASSSMCAIASGGANAGVIYCWGNGSTGQVGNGGAYGSVFVPNSVTMPSGVTAFNQISVNDGASFNCAIASAGANAGRVYCWGIGTSGQIGNGSSITVNVPTGVTMPIGVTAFNQIVTSYNSFACAIASAGANAGKIYCWGSGSVGQLGNGSSSNVNVPTSVTMPSGVTAFSQVSTSGVTCAVASAGANAGKIYCWGNGGNGQIGNGSSANVSVPTSVTMPSGVTAFSQVSVSSLLVCALASVGSNAGKIYCWGNGGSGGIGNGSNGNVNVPTLATMPSGVTAFSIVVNTNYNTSNITNCAIASAGANAGKIYCWGTGNIGQIGNGSSSNVNVPTSVTMPSGVTAFSQVSTGGNMSNCAIASAGSNSGNIYCWGNGGSGQLGNGSTSNKNVPTLAPF